LSRALQSPAFAFVAAAAAAVSLALALRKLLSVRTRD
jgi:hypothetical protein